MKTTNELNYWETELEKVSERLKAEGPTMSHEELVKLVDRHKELATYCVQLRRQAATV